MGEKKRALPQRKNDFGRDFRLEKKDYLIILGEGIGLTVLLAWVFYNSVFGCLLFPGVLVFVYRAFMEKKRQKVSSKFDLEFKELLVAVSDALQSGYSIENAFKDAEENLRLLFGDKGMLIKDIKEMNTKVSMRVPAEQAFNEFVGKHPTEEAIGFAGVFSFARRLGGEYVKNLRRTIEKMEDKLELKEEIRAGIAEKQMEFKVMCVMPIGILAYVKFSSKDFLSAMYGNALGVLVMTVCIAVYLGAILLGKKIVDIKV